VRVLAIDWSGKLKREGEHLWIAEVRDGQLVTLENGRDRQELIAQVVATTDDDPRTVVALDFAFSFPKWWCDEHGWGEARAVWSAMATLGEGLLSACDEPLWGRPGKTNPNTPKRSYRRTDRRANGDTAKSVFQVGGAGAVGTGSIRGMPHLTTLADHGFSIWPFDASGWPRVIEIYPRALTGPVNKSRWADRHAYLHTRFPEQPPELLERAAGSEDAFDAAASALMMARHEDELANLSATDDPFHAIEGAIWRPGNGT
jgi:hypothetical protein